MRLKLFSASAKLPSAVRRALVSAVSLLCSRTAFLSEATKFRTALSLAALAAFICCSRESCCDRDAAAADAAPVDDRFGRAPTSSSESLGDTHSPTGKRGNTDKIYTHTKMYTK